jgi:hypothetical protein
MIIKADKEAIQAIQQLCDIALKAGGIQNLQGIQAVLAGVSEIEE